MKKNEALILLILSIYLPSLFGCCDKSVFPGYSENISESKEKGVFEIQMTPINNPIVVGDSIKIRVIEAWVEKSWLMGRDNFCKEKITFQDGYVLHIIASSESVASLGREWSIGVDAASSILKRKETNTHAYLVGYLDSIPIDSISFPVKNTVTIKGNVDNVIGDIILIPKW